MVSSETSSLPPPSTASPKIPIVDFSLFRSTDPSARHACASALVAACRDVGFVYIANHGVPAPLLERAFSFSQALFALPLAEKMKAPHPPGFAVHRGYSSVGLEKVSQTMVMDENDEAGREEARRVREEVKDCKESYEIGSEQFEQQPNVWLPEETLPGYREFMKGFYWTCKDVANDILRCIALGLGMESEEEVETLLKPHTGMNNQLRLLHYPPVEAELVRAGKAARMPAHSDWSSITMLFQDARGGLEVESPTSSGEFIAAKPIKNTLVMNIGDLLMRWSNDKLKSTLHRVTLPEDMEGAPFTQPRYSIPYFVAPDPDAVVQCLPNCASKERPAQYEPITQAAYCTMRASAHYET